MKTGSFSVRIYTTKTVQNLLSTLCIFSLLSLNNSFTASKRLYYFSRLISSDTIQPVIRTVKSQTVRVIFWNVENLYDTYDDTTKLDDEFTPQGTMRWNYRRFQLKLSHVAKALLAAGEWEAPGIIGLCEVENRYVMNRMIYESPLKSYGYRMIHHESPDLRGIDVALLYRPAAFSVIRSKPFRITFPFDTSAQTREILFIQGRVLARDTLDLLINHWPSRRGGYAESQPRRDFVASVLRHIIDSLFAENREARILIMGDFNDEPASASITNILHAIPPDSMRDQGELINLMFPLSGREGTHRYRGIWSLLDQFMASTGLIRPARGLHLIPGSVGIFRGTFLLKEDLKYFGSKPFRTYNGFRYEGGFSDHLPVYLDLAY